MPGSGQGGTFSSLFSEAELLGFAGETTSLPLLVFCSASNEYSWDRRVGKRERLGQRDWNLCSSINSWSNQDNREAVWRIPVEKLHSHVDKTRLCFSLCPPRLKQLSSQRFELCNLLNLSLPTSLLSFWEPAVFQGAALQALLQAGSAGDKTQLHHPGREKVSGQSSPAEPGPAEMCCRCSVRSRGQKMNKTCGGCSPQ